MEFKNLKFQIKMNPNEEGRFSGYAAFKGNVDSYGDICVDGCFKRTLRNRKAFPIFFNHDPNQPVGISTVMREDKSGLYTEGQIDLSTPLGQMVYSGLRMKYLSSMSIGYQVMKDEIDKKGNRLLKEIKLLEYSILPVGFGANELATVEAVKHRSSDRIASREEVEEHMLRNLLTEVKEMREKLEEQEEMIIELKERMADPPESTQPYPHDPPESTLEVKEVDEEQKQNIEEAKPKSIDTAAFFIAMKKYNEEVKRNDRTTS